MSTNITALAEAVARLEAAQEDAARVADTTYIILTGALVFFMQCGFGMLEAGAVRSKATQNIMLKNLLDACVGALAFWLCGYGMA